MFRVSLYGLVLWLCWTSASAQDDVTTRNGPSSYDGAFITGPASNPLSFLNGPAYRTFASSAPYLLPDFHPASALNERLPAWISFGVEERIRWESYRNSGFIRGSGDSYLLNRFRFQMNLQPARWLKLVTQVQDARSSFQKPPLGPPNEARWDLKLAYAEIGDPETHWLSLRVGRQLINYNNSIAANSEWRNQGRSFDAAVVNLRFRKLRLGIFAGSIVNALDQGLSHHQAGNNLYGLSGGIDNWLGHSAIEPFVLWRVRPSVAGGGGSMDEKAYGLRYKGAIAALEYSVEGIVERGTDTGSAIHAWAGSGGAAYRFHSVAWKPRVFLQYDYASGDKDLNDGRRGSFDTMYPTAHDRFGIADQFGWQNIIAYRAGFTFEPRARWTVTGQFLGFQLASATDALYNSSGNAIVRDISGRSGTKIGVEWDAYTWFELNRHVNMGAGVGRLNPGSFLKGVNRSASYTYPYFAVNFKDNSKARSR